MEIETDMYKNNIDNGADGNIDGNFNNDNLIAWNLFMMTGNPDDYMLYRRIREEIPADKRR